MFGGICQASGGNGEFHRFAEAGVFGAEEGLHVEVYVLVGGEIGEGGFEGDAGGVGDFGVLGFGFAGSRVLQHGKGRGGGEVEKDFDV